MAQHALGTDRGKSPLDPLQGAQSLKPDASMSAVTGEPPMRGVIRGLVASSGSGCEAVLMSHSNSGQPPCWTTRLHPAQEESFCSLELRRYPCSNLQVKVTFGDAASTAKSITFAHGKSPGRWEKLGSMPLRSHGSSCLQHVIKLGAHTQVERYLRITLQGLLHPPRDGSTFHGSHRIVRLRVLAPSAAVGQSTSDRISAYWPSRSVARSTAAAQEAGSGPMGLPKDCPDNEATGDRMRSSGPLGSHMAARPHLAGALPPLRKVQAPTAEVMPMADGTKADNGHIVALTPSARTLLPQAGAGAAGDGKLTAPVSQPQQGRAAPPPPPPPPPKPPAPPGGHKAPSRAPPPPPPPPKMAPPTGPSNGALPVGSAAKGPPRPPPPPPLPGKPGAARAGVPPPPPLPGKGALGRRPPSKAAPQSGASAPQQAAPVAGPTPSKPMVKLFWDKLPDKQLENTVWGQLGKSPAEVDYQILEDEFAAKQAVMQIGKGGGAQQRPKQALLLPLQRAQNVGVFLTRLKMGPAQVKEEILGIAHGKGGLSTEDIAGLIRCLPSADEREMLQRHSASYAELGMAEQFMLSMMSIPQVGQRLRAVQFQRQFDRRHEALHAQIQTLEDACTETRNNRLLPCVLKTCLDVGNYLNAGHRAGAAAGFQIESLLKLKAVRSSKHPGRTLLHFVARQVAKKLGEEMPLGGGLQRVAAAAKVSLSAMQSELQDLSASCAQLQRLLDSLSLPDMDPFVEEMKAFHAEADLSIEKLRLQLASAQEQFAHLAAYVNGAAKTSVSDPQAFFAMLLTFARDLDSAHRDNLAADEQSRKRAKKAAVAKGRAPQAGALKQRDRMLSQVKAYQRLRPEDRRALLTDKGARERLLALGLNERASVPSLRLALATEAAAEAAAAAPCSAAKRMRCSLRLPLTSRMAGVDKGPSPMPSARRSTRSHRDGLAARSLCIPLGATGRGGLQESLAKASRAAQSGLRARQKDLQAADAPDVLTDPEIAGLKQADPAQPPGAPETQASAHQRTAESVQANAALRTTGQPSTEAQAYAEPAAGGLTQAQQEQHGADSAPLPTASTTPESLPSDRRGPSGSSDSAAQIQHVDLFEQLGPRPLQSLAAGSIAREPARPAAPADQESQPGETEANTSCSGPAALRAAEEAAVDAMAEPNMHSCEDRGRDSADSAGFGDSGWTSQQRAKQAKPSVPSALPVVPEASTEESPSGAEKSRQGGPLRRSLLPAVHPRFRSSPLRTPAVIQSLSHLPDRATSAQSGQSRGPGSSNVIISSSWDRSAKQADEHDRVISLSSASQGSLQQRLQQAAMRLMGSQPLHAKAGNLGLRLHQAAMEAQAASSPYDADINSKPEQAESDVQGMGDALQQKQRRFMALPNRPSSIRKTPVPGSAQRAPALDMPAEESASQSHSVMNYSPNMSELLGFVPTPKTGTASAAAERPAPKPSVASSYSFGMRDRPGSTGSTPVLYPGSYSAAEAVPAPLRSASPKQLGRPRSAGRDISSHPVSLSDHSAEDAGALREPLGHSLDKGALQQMGLAQDSERKRVFNDIGVSGHISDSLALIASMRVSPGPLGKSADPRGPITDAAGTAECAEAAASNDHCGITPLLNAGAAGTREERPSDADGAAGAVLLPSPSGSGLGDIDARLCCQPLRSSLFLHSLGDSVDAAASLSLADCADCPGPLEAGHLKARDLILTPAECKGRRSRRRKIPSPEAAKPPVTAEAESEEADLMLFTPQAAGVDTKVADQLGQTAGRPTVLKAGKQLGRHPWWSGRRWRRIPESQRG